MLFSNHLQGSLFFAVSLLLFGLSLQIEPPARNYVGSRNGSDGIENTDILATFKWYGHAKCMTGDPRFGWPPPESCKSALLGMPNDEQALLYKDRNAVGTSSIPLPQEYLSCGFISQWLLTPMSNVRSRWSMRHRSIPNFTKRFRSHWTSGA